MLLKRGDKRDAVRELQRHRPSQEPMPQRIVNMNALPRRLPCAGVPSPRHNLPDSTPAAGGADATAWPTIAGF